MMYKDATILEIDKAAQAAWSAFRIYRNISWKERALFLRAIAREIEQLGDRLIQTAMQETHLPEARLSNERSRTLFQLRSYGDAAEKGDCFEPTIDTGDEQRTPLKPDIRKLLLPIGPVAVFGAANFPFAYSTAGGDTASALAAGCPVIVKAHPAHPHTSTLVAEAIQAAAAQCQLPPGVFAHVHGAGHAVGRTLVEHPLVKGVGFTGSLAGGKQLFDWANARISPIPVFAEMSSINPVFLLPEKLRDASADIAAQYAASITLGVGQFCTNPGLLIGLESETLTHFMHDLGKAILHTQPGTMLHAGIVDNYSERREEALMQEDVHLVAESQKAPAALQAAATLATVTGKTFLHNPVLHKEVFGPYSLVVRCADPGEMLEVARQLEGQLTATIMGTETDLQANALLVEAIKDVCGRLVLNGVPTGVEVGLAMQHGGPYPATTDARFTAVGADAIRRFVRPVAFQHWPDHLLHPALQNANPLGLLRRVNGEWTNAAIPV